MLSKRLRTIANLISKNEVVYDVGTDHALLPCFLVNEGICQKVYASDINEGPLAKARENIKRYHLENKVIPVLTDGIDESFDDITTIVIAGMGFYTVKEILEKANLNKYKRIIVQINKDVNLLREYLSTQEYTILDEEIVYDGFFYEIIVFNTEKSPKLTDLEIEYGPINLKEKSAVFKEYLTSQVIKLERINQDKYQHKLIELKQILATYNM